MIKTGKSVFRLPEHASCAELVSTDDKIPCPSSAETQHMQLVRSSPQWYMYVYIPCVREMYTFAKSEQSKLSHVKQWSSVYLLLQRLALNEFKFGILILCN